MSLVRLALRVCAVEAIKGRTLVGNAVADSDFSALDMSADGDLTTDRDQPFVTVFTEGSKADEGLDLRSLRQNGRVEFVVEFGVATPMLRTDPDTAETVIWGVPATDANFERALDVIDRQIGLALTADNPWADLWRTIAGPLVSIERQRRATTDDGMRLAARQLRFTVDALPDPEPGVAGVTGVWPRFAAAIAGHEAEPMVTLLLTGQQEGWDAVIGGRGMTSREAAASGIMPLGTIEGADLG